MESGNMKRARFRVERHTVKSILIFTAIACAINLAVFLVINKIDFVHFAMSDDFYIQNLLNGSMGEYYTYFQQMNVALVGLLSGLYKLSDAVNWYGWLVFLALLLSAGIAGGIVMDKFGPKLGTVLYIATIPFFFGWMLANITFTFACYAMMAASVMCLIYGFYIKNKKPARMLYVVSIVLAVLAVLLRVETVATLAVYAGSLVVLLLIKYKKRALGLILAVAVMFGAIGIFVAIDQVSYNSDAELKEYKRYNTARSYLHDKVPLDHTRYMEVFMTYGWDVNDIFLFKEFYVPDLARYDVERLEGIYEGLAPIHTNDDAADIFVQIRSVFNSDYVYMLLFLFVLFGVALTTQRCGWFKAYTVLLAALPFLFNILFVVLWRAVFRVTYPHYVISAMVLMLFVDLEAFAQADLGKTGKRIASAVFAGLVAMATVGVANMLLRLKWASDERWLEYGEAIEGIPQVYEYAGQNKDKAFVYVPTAKMGQSNQAYSIFHAFPKDSLENIRLIGGWDARSPSYYDFEDKYGLYPLPESLINNEDVYMITSGEGVLEGYLRNYYGIEVQYAGAADIAGGMQIAHLTYDGTMDDKINRHGESLDEMLVKERP